MKIVYHYGKNIGKNLSLKQLLEFHKVKYNYDKSVIGTFLYFDLIENSPQIELIKELDGQGIRPSQIYTKFTPKEQVHAAFLELNPQWHHGYPMPQEDGGWEALIYDLSDYCLECGTGYNQKAPFRMKSEPKWGKRHLLQLHWIYDEYFVLPEVWQEYFKPLGIDCRPVLHYKKETELKTVVQLVIDEVATSPLKREALEGEYCRHCERIKYNYVVRGYWPPFAEPQNGLIFKTQEYFGSGHAADKGIIVSNQLYRIIVDNKLKGVDFKPLAEFKAD